jgi:hypothetical protein
LRHERGNHVVKRHDRGAGEYMRPRIEAEQTGAGMLRAFVESNLAFMAENRNHMPAASPR